jgi:hypothetical protein
MNRILKCALLLGVTICAAQAYADDSMTRATPTDQQLLKDCIEKQKASDVTMSKAAMKRMCKDQLKQQKATGVPLDAPPTDTPRN